MENWQFIENAIKTLKYDYKYSNNKKYFVNSLVKDFVKLEDKNGQLSAENSDLKVINDHLRSVNGMDTARYYAKVAR